VVAGMGVSRLSVETICRGVLGVLRLEGMEGWRERRYARVVASYADDFAAVALDCCDGGHGSFSCVCCFRNRSFLFHVCWCSGIDHPDFSFSEPYVLLVRRI
jgi:hypothetical protein